MNSEIFLPSSPVLPSPPGGQIEAVRWAHELHAHQRRPFTNAPYVSHLAEVAGIVMTAAMHNRMSPLNDVPEMVLCAVSWLHDSMEDQGVTRLQIEHRLLCAGQMGGLIGLGVQWLSDLEEEGTRAQRKALSRDRLSRSPGWVQSIKCADVISNLGGLNVSWDPSWSRIYVKEKRALLEVLSQADPLLRSWAGGLVEQRQADLLALQEASPDGAAGVERPRGRAVEGG